MSEVDASGTFVDVASITQTSLHALAMQLARVALASWMPLQAPPFPHVSSGEMKSRHTESAQHESTFD